MAEMLKDWLSRRLQQPFSWEAEEFGEKMKNGHVIASILLNYHVINDDKYYLIRPSNLDDDVQRNWKYLKEWLRSIEININDVEMISIINGKGSEILRLFYQLFLHLDKMDRTNFIKQERKAVSKLVDKLDQRFVVNKIDEIQELSVDDLSKPLLDQRMLIEWQRKKEKDVKEQHDYMRHKYSKTLAKIEESHILKKQEISNLKKVSMKDKSDMEKFSKKYPCEFHNYTYEELLELEKRAVERKKSFVESDWVRNYMNNIHVKIHKKAESEEFQKQLADVISSSLWDLSIAEEESKVDMELAKKVMKLSQFEKQMCTQIMETKQQARNLIKSRIASEHEFIDQRTEQFNQFLDNVREEINLGISEIDFEKDRQNMLHKKLYAEKRKRKRQHYYEICYETMLSIVDFATKYAYFKRLLDSDIPDHFLHEWKMLYYKQQPIFDILEPMENLLKQVQEEEELIAEEEIIRLELDRQETLNEGEFLEYHNFSHPWLLESLIPNYDPGSEDRKYEYLGARILGHVVYTLLEIKYPYPPQRLPANLPIFTSKAIVRGIPDRLIASAMQTLLNEQKIHVVRLEAAINFCLRKFKIEMIGCDDIELSYDKFLASAQEEEGKELIKLMKEDDEVHIKSAEANLAAQSGPLLANIKQTQTPKTIPEEDITFSTPADLGRYAYECLNFGDSLTDHLLCAIIVEYIKDQKNINGFVIINYPNCYREAQILEETFLGRAPPDENELEDQDDIYLEESIIKHRKREKDPYKNFRLSKLVMDPHKKRDLEPFSSYFTCYLNLKESENILQESFIWYLTKENSDLIDRFYAVMGINYSMYYEVIEKEQLALICKYIIGDYTMYLNSTDKLFGENVLSVLDFPTSDLKRTKSKIVKPETSNEKSKDRIRCSSKLSRLSFANELQSTKLPDSIKEIYQENILEEMNKKENLEKMLETTDSFEEIELLAGEEDWIYGEIPIPEGIGRALSTCWEEIEKNYINDLQQLFFAKRLQMNCVTPYTRFIKDKMEQIITLPSIKQDIVSSFQKEYNDFENDWRGIHVTKNEWHCRINDLQNRLFKICDDRKIYAEQQRQALILDNWTMEELTTMANIYISCMQAELNRSILTYQIMHDFYFVMIKGSPPNDRLISKELTKIFKDTDETSGSKKGGEDKVFRQLRACFQEMQMKNIEIDYSNNPFNMIIENNVKFALKVIKDTNDSYRSLISREYSEIAKIMPVKKKEENISEESINSEEIFKSNALKCIEEWTMGINGEMYRANLRLLALQYKCYKDMKLFNDIIFKAFTTIQNDINNYYLNEIKAVDRLCKYFQIAVEGGNKIPESLILEQDLFIIDPNILQYPDTEPKVYDDNKLEFVSELEFKINQLAKLRDQFKILAPTGIALQQAFIYLIQDFIFFGRESCEGPMFPEVWKRIDPEQVPKLVFLLFGDMVYVDWRDFLIYCLNIPLPTLDDLLLLRKKFRKEDINCTELISRNKFLEEILWFERDLNPENKIATLRNILTKHFLFELFESAENLMNYSAFLLAFCKASSPIEGFAMALSIAIGKKVCYSLEECEEIVCKFIKDKKYRDEHLACANKCVAQYLEKLIINVINVCEGTTIIELEHTEPSPETERKGKKSKSSTKSKKIDSVQSARIPKTQKSLTSRSKIEPSKSDVRITHICTPCKEDVVEEKETEKNEIQEEIKVEPEPNPNLAYAVSQNTIYNVLQICLPWYFQLIPEEGATPYLEQVKEVILRLEQDTDNRDIYVCKFVNDQNICKLLHSTKKFVALDLASVIQKVFMCQ